MNKESRIFVAGHNGMVGSTIVRTLQAQGFTNVLTADRKLLDLQNQLQTEQWFQRYQPEYVFMAAARVGGIHANKTYPAEFIHENIIVQDNMIRAAYLVGVKKLVFLGSVCIYPKHAPEPVKEASLLTGPLEPTNEWYAIAKIAGIKTCQAFRRQYGCNYVSVMPCNLYGVGDNFHPVNSHVLPALLRRFHEAKVSGAANVTCWGTGAARREFLNASDAAEAIVFVMEHYDEEEIINIGCGRDYTIREMAEMIKGVTGFGGEIEWDRSKPDGTPGRVLDVSRLSALGWKSRVELRDGLKETYEWFLKAQG